MASPSAGAHAVARRMVVEKQMAFAEGTVGTQMEMAKLAMTPWWLWPSAAAMNIGHAATGPRLTAGEG